MSHRHWLIACPQSLYFPGLSWCGGSADLKALDGNRVVLLTAGPPHPAIRSCLFPLIPMPHRPPPRTVRSGGAVHLVGLYHPFQPNRCLLLAIPQVRAGACSGSWDADHLMLTTATAPTRFRSSITDPPCRWDHRVPIRVVRLPHTHPFCRG